MAGAGIKVIKNEDMKVISLNSTMLLVKGIITLFHHIGELDNTSSLYGDLPVMHSPARTLFPDH